MDCFQFVSALSAALNFNALPYIAASVAAAVAMSPFVAYGSRAVNDLRLAMNVERWSRWIG